MAVSGFGEIAEQLRRSTVVVHVGGRGCGSGVIWSSDGLIVTNAHVVRSSNTRVQLWDGRELRADLVSRDVRRDIAQLHISAGDLSAATFADSSLVRPGELAIAIGNPLGFVGALTTGVVHAVGPLPQLGPTPWVQADVRLAPGNSGGPLADARGQVIGINTMVAGRLALAVPSNTVAHALRNVSSDGWLGVAVQPVRVPGDRSRREAFGLLIVEMDAEGPASLASLLPGDIVLGTAERRFTSAEDLARALEGNGPRMLRLEFLRGDYQRLRRVTVQLGAGQSHRTAAA
jgi:serine protease Do